jgi:hypothetical protein
MDTPPPVNLAALSGILAKSRQVMAKVENEKPIKTKSNVMNENHNVEYADYDERDEREPVYEQYQQPTTGFDPTNVQDYTDDQVMNSNMPAAIKEAMLKNRIPKLISPPSKFTAEDISRITGAPIRKPTSSNQTPIVESHKPQYSSDMITVSKAELKEMINEGISTFFKQIYDKTLTEETIKKTINVLIKEGKLNIKRKTI